MVRKGIQRQLRSEIDADVERFFELYADNLHRHGTPPHSRAYFRALRRVFGDDCEVLTVLGPDGQAVSGVMSFYFRDEVLPYYAGDIPAARELAANDFKYWELMRRACERGIRMFDYGRSKRDTGSFDFKKNWGFEPEPLHYEYRLYNARIGAAEQPCQPEVPARPSSCGAGCRAASSTRWARCWPGTWAELRAYSDDIRPSAPGGPHPASLRHRRAGERRRQPRSTACRRDRFRHCIVALTEITEFRRRIERDDVPSSR